MSETRATFLRQAMLDRALGVRELGRLCADVLEPAADRYDAVADDWKGRIGDYTTELSDGGSEPRDKALRILSAALKIDPSDWPPVTPAANVRQLDRRVRSLEATVGDSPESDQTVLDRLVSLEAEVEAWKGLVLEALELLDLQANPEADPGSRVQRRAARRTRAGGTRP